jgi:hypothetical protein
VSPVLEIMTAWNVGAHVPSCVARVSAAVSSLRSTSQAPITSGGSSGGSLFAMHAI